MSQVQGKASHDQPKASLTLAAHERIRGYWEGRFGVYGGWAHCFLFAAQLPEFREGERDGGRKRKRQSGKGEGEEKEKVGEERKEGVEGVERKEGVDVKKEATKSTTERKETKGGPGRKRRKGVDKK